MPKHTIAFVAVLAGSALLGQEPAAGAQKPPDARVEQRSQAMREQIGAGRQVESHVRVAVRLKNGNRLSGVVKDGKLVERVDSLRFVEAQAGEAGAGIRLWYSGSGRNYVFVPFADFAEYEVLQRLTNKQLADLEREMQVEEKRAVPVTQKSDAELATDGNGDKPATPAGEGAVASAKAPAAGAGATASDKDKDKEAQQRRWYALLSAYPPKEGWNRAKRDEIARRFVVIGARPSATEQKFVDEFADWEKACEHFGVEAKPADTGAAGASNGKDKAKASSKAVPPPPTTPATSGDASATGSKSRHRR